MNERTGQIEPLDAEQLAGMFSAYTEVTERLQSSHDRLVAEVARLRAELASKNKQLERRSRLAALGEMAAGMAHEIRNPLGGIALYAGLLSKQLIEQPKSQALAEKIARGVSQLDVIVNDILAFAGEIKPQQRSVTLKQILTEAQALAGGRFERAGTQLQVSGASDATFRADPGLLVRAVGNLLFNACDAAGEGEVRLVGRVEDQQVVVEVSDSGPGLSAESMERLFNPFYTTKEQGTGLGLAIVHRIAESHGGTVSAENAAGADALGGARFVLRLPIEQE